MPCWAAAACAQSGTTTTGDNGGGDGPCLTDAECGPGLLCEGGFCTPIVDMPDAGPGRALISVDPERLEMGAVQVGAEVCLTGKVRNLGDAPARVSGVRLVPAGLEEYRLSVPGLGDEVLTLAPDDDISLAFEVCYAPRDPGCDQATLEVTGDFPTVDIPVVCELKGQALCALVADPGQVQAELITDADLDPHTAAIRFDAEAPGERLTQRFFVVNAGEGNAAATLQEIRTEPRAAEGYMLQAEAQQAFLPVLAEIPSADIDAGSVQLDIAFEAGPPGSQRAATLVVVCDQGQGDVRVETTLLGVTAGCPEGFADIGSGECDYACPVFPVEAETCNGLDDDCDGETDEAEDIGEGPGCGDEGVCAGVVARCEGVEGFVCAYPPLHEPGGETRCDGVDNDCDGFTDVGLTNACEGCGELAGLPETPCDDGVHDGACGRWRCVPGGARVTCEGDDSANEVCDGADNDCDGDTDEGVTNACGGCGELGGALGQACDDGAHPGACGALACAADGASLVCSGDDSADELCDGADNDCDGDTDEGVTNACGGCAVLDGATGDPCDDGVHPGACGALACAPDGDSLVCAGDDSADEVCNGADDDCDGDTDEGVTNACGGCAVLASAPGEACDDGVHAGACGAWACADDGESLVCAGDGSRDELCNGEDDDCDGDTDEGVTNACAGCAVLSAAPGEACDDGVHAGACGAWACADDGESLACAGDDSTDEVCNGADDDCDGDTDEGVANACGGCTSLDGAVGDPCDDGAHPGACGRLACAADGASLICAGDDSADEICDGADNDCDGDTDEGVTNACGGCAALGAAPGEACDDGSHTGACGAWICAEDGASLICAGDDSADEVCNGADDDCDGDTDEGVTNACAGCAVLADAPGAPCDDGAHAGACGSWTCAPDGESLRCEGDDSADELCNGADDDCDGDTDEGVSNACGGCAALGGELGAPCDDGVHPGACGALACAPDGESLVCDGDDSADEVCNGADDDCDGDTDEGVTNACGGCAVLAGAPGESCDDGAHAGACGSWACAPDGESLLCAGDDSADEVCNGADDDCDGDTDEGVTNACGGCGVLTEAPGAACDDGVHLGACGTWTCAGDGEALDCLGDDSGDESCDGEDNDCDGVTDNPEQLIPGVDCSGGIGVCADAVPVCMNGGWSCLQSDDFEADAETSCDGLDNDCDGDTDEGLLDACGGCPGIDPPCGCELETCAPTNALGCCSEDRCRVARCDEGWHDVDGDPLNGCEYACVPANGGVEIGGNGIDEDCSGVADDANAGYEYSRLHPLLTQSDLTQVAFHTCGGAYALVGTEGGGLLRFDAEDGSAGSIAGLPADFEANSVEFHVQGGYALVAGLTEDSGSREARVYRYDHDSGTLDATPLRSWALAKHISVAFSRDGSDVVVAVWPNFSSHPVEVYHYDDESRGFGPQLTLDGFSQSSLDSIGAKTLSFGKGPFDAPGSPDTVVLIPTGSINLVRYRPALGQFDRINGPGGNPVAARFDPTGRVAMTTTAARVYRYEADIVTDDAPYGISWSGRFHSVGWNSAGTRALIVGNAVCVFGELQATIAEYRRDAPIGDAFRDATLLGYGAAPWFADRGAHLLDVAWQPGRDRGLIVGRAGGSSTCGIQGSNAHGMLVCFKRGGEPCW